MNSVSFFYNIFTTQEIILKLNNLNLKDTLQFKKCILFKPSDGAESSREIFKANSDIRYVLEFLTNTKLNSSIDSKFVFKMNVNKQKSYNLFIYFSYLIFTRSNFILETNTFEYDYPVVQKTNLIDKLVSTKTRNFIDIRFKNGLNLPFLSDNEHMSWLAINFFIRLIFNRPSYIDSFFEVRQYIYMSLIGFKFILIKKHNNNNK